MASNGQKSIYTVCGTTEMKSKITANWGVGMGILGAVEEASTVPE